MQIRQGLLSGSTGYCESISGFSLSASLGRSLVSSSCFFLVWARHLAAADQQAAGNSQHCQQVYRDLSGGALHR